MNPRVLAMVALGLLVLMFGIDLLEWFIGILGYAGLLPKSFEFSRFLGVVYLLFRVVHELALLGSLGCLGASIYAMTRPMPQAPGHYGPPGW